MKKNIISIIVCVMAVCVQTASAQISTIKGKWERERFKGMENISLFQVVNGNMEEIATAKIDPENNFYFALNPKKQDFFVIGFKESLFNDKDYFFLKPGDKLNVVIQTNSYKLVGENTKENLEVERWHNFILPLENIALFNKVATYVDYFPKLEEMLPALKAYKSNYSKNKIFNEKFEAQRELDILRFSLHLITSMRTSHPHDDDFIDYYRKLAVKDYTQDERILNYPWGMSMLGSLEYICTRLNNYKLPENDLKELRSSPIGKMEFRLSQIENERLKGEYIIDRTSMIRTYEGFVDFKEKYEKYLINEDQIDRFNQNAARFGNNTAGELAVGFTFPDVNGKEVSLSDFRGKVVYIDVWATWCGPCLAELPHLIALEKAYHDKDVVFMSVSVDKQKNFDVWKKMITDKGLKGVQLFAGDKANHINEPYKIDGIPRFIMVGKDGKLISGDATRPSNPETKLVLDKALLAK